MDFFKLCCTVVVLLYVSGDTDATNTCVIRVIEPDYSRYVRPCDLGDISCLRRFFTSEGFCSSASTKQQCSSKIACFDNVISDMPTLNATIISSLKVKGLHNGYINELYYNKITKTLVLSIMFTDLKIYHYASVYYHRFAEEDLNIVMPKISEFYCSLATTTQVSSCKKFSANDTMTTTYVLAVPDYSFEGVECVTDPEALELFVSIAENEYSSVQELNKARGPLYVDYYIQNVICNSKYSYC